MRFRDVIDNRPAKLSEILDCLNSDHWFERQLGSVMLRFWMADPADTMLQRLALANVVKRKARRLEGRASKKAESRTAYVAKIQQAGARMSPKNAHFYDGYYWALGESFVESAPDANELTDLFRKKLTWLPEAVAMLAGLHRMHDIARDTNTAFYPSLEKGYRFAHQCILEIGPSIDQSLHSTFDPGRGKKTVEQNLSAKNLSPCIWYCAWRYKNLAEPSDPRFLSEIVLNSSNDLDKLYSLLAGALYVWETVAPQGYKNRCGEHGLALQPARFDAQKLSSDDERILMKLMDRKPGRKAAVGNAGVSRGTQGTL